MNKVLIGAALLAGIAVGAGGIAVAQTPPGGPGPGHPPGSDPGSDMDDFGMGPHGRGRMGPHGPHGMMRRPPSRAAMFAINRGDTRLMVKCSEEESTRACVDAASALLDKMGAGTAASR